MNISQENKEINNKIKKITNLNKNKNYIVSFNEKYKDEIIYNFKLYDNIIIYKIMKNCDYLSIKTGFMSENIKTSNSNGIFTNKFETKLSSFLDENLRFTKFQSIVPEGTEIYIYFEKSKNSDNNNNKKGYTTIIIKNDTNEIKYIKLDGNLQKTLYKYHSIIISKMFTENNKEKIINASENFNHK